MMKVLVVGPRKSRLRNPFELELIDQIRNHFNPLTYYCIDEFSEVPKAPKNINPRDIRSSDLINKQARRKWRPDE